MALSVAVSGYAIRRKSQTLFGGGRMGLLLPITRPLTAMQRTADGEQIVTLYEKNVMQNVEQAGYSSIFIMKLLVCPACIPWRSKDHNLVPTRNRYKAVPRFGELYSCCCLPLLPQYACSILATWEWPYSRAL